MPTDEILVKKALAGDKEAFGKLVEKYDSAVYGLAYHLVGNFTDAQDLAQEVFISAYTKLHQLREHSKFSSWLRAITTNICKTWLRKKQKEKTALDFITEKKISENKPSPEELVIAKEERDLVMKAVASLPEKSRLAVTLYYLDGMSYQQIADFLSVSRSAIDSRLNRARQRLKQEMIAMMERTFTEHKLPTDFRARVMENLSNRWIDLYGGREDVIGYALCGDATRNEFWEGSVVEMVFLRETQEKIGWDHRVAPVAMVGFEHGVMITGFDISTGKMEALIKDHDVFCKSVIPPRLYGCRIYSDPRGKLAHYKGYVESALISPEVINKRASIWLTEAEINKREAEYILEELKDYPSALWFIRKASLFAGYAAFIKYGGYPGENLELCRRFPALLKQVCQNAGIISLYEHFAVTQDLGKDKSATQESLHKFRELMFSLWNLPVAERLEKYEGAIEKSKFAKIFNLGFSWVTTWLLSMELWGESVVDTEHHDGILLMFRTPMIGGPAEYPLNLMFDMEELLSNGEFDHRLSDFVRQLSTFQHIPKESYLLFLETYALVDATEEKARGLMKRLDAMLKMLS